MTIYDTIGHGYGRLRREDPRILRRVVRGLGEATSVLNVGAGAGSYEPRDRRVVALEPSDLMIRQRRRGAAPVVRGSATHLPFRDATFDAALAILTVHHWADRLKGLEEMSRSVRRRVVLVTWDPSAPGFWLTDYFPDILDIDRKIFPSMADLSRSLGQISVVDIPIPHDCIDGFLGAYWRRPHAYLEDQVRAAISTFAKIRSAEPGLARLRHDLASGAWDQRYGWLRQRAELDLGYRLVVA